MHVRNVLSRLTLRWKRAKPRMMKVTADVGVNSRWDAGQDQASDVYHRLGGQGFTLKISLSKIRSSIMSDPT
jgi:hypothetical protein